MSNPAPTDCTARAGSSRTQKLLNGALLFKVPESLRLVSDLGATTFGVDDLGVGNPLKVTFGRLPGDPLNRCWPLWPKLSWWFLLLFSPFWGRPVAMITPSGVRQRMNSLRSGTSQAQWLWAKRRPLRLQRLIYINTRILCQAILRKLQ